MEKSTILVVDDETLIRICLSDYLQEEGFKTLEAASLKEAKAIIDAGDVDLVLTDIRMDGPFDGIELAKYLRGRKPGLPVVFVSGNSPDKADQELGAGQHFLTKPVDYRKMAGLIGSLLARGAADADGSLHVG